MRTPSCVLLSCALVAAPLPATAADGEGRVAVLPLRVEGQADDATRREWMNGLRRGIGRGQFEVVEQGKVEQIADSSCERKSCLEKVRTGTKATHLVRTTITIKNRDYAIRLDLVDATSGQVIVNTEDRCEICGVEEVANLLDSQGALLQTRLAAMGKAPPVLVLDTKPSGARVYVDGEVVGTTPIERPVLPGTHRIRVSLDGYIGEERELNFVEGVREQAQFELQRTPGNPKKRLLGGVALGGGIVLIGGGIGLLAAQIPYKKDCSEMNGTADMMGDCRYLLNTSWGGAAMAVAGAVLVTLGVVALLRNRGAKPAKQARIIPTGLGFAGRF